MSSPLFDSIESMPEDPVLGLAIDFQNDKNAQKIFLGIGAYQTEEGLPWVLPAVRLAEQQLFEKKLDKEYLPIEGDAEYIQAALSLTFGEVDKRCIAAAQSVGGVGALRCLADLITRLMGSKKIYLPNPTWPNHEPIFKQAGFVPEVYPYYQPKTQKLDWPALLASVETMKPKEVMLLHVCCQNPTGVDLKEAEWRFLAKKLKEKGVIPFFDMAYQGFGEGIEEDRRPLSYFLDEGLEFFVAVSYSKNFALYAERIGLMAVVTKNFSAANKLLGHMKKVIRVSYSNPPCHGARIIKTILQDPKLRQEWVANVKTMRDRILKMRLLLKEKLESRLKQDFSFLVEQKGMFSFTGLKPEQVIRLKKDWAIHMPLSGRINVAGLNEQNIDRVVEAIANA